MANISATDGMGAPVKFLTTWIQSINNLKDSLDDLTASLQQIKNDLK